MGAPKSTKACTTNRVVGRGPHEDVDVTSGSCDAVRGQRVGTDENELD
jgi:hypothetical protein